MLVIKWSIQSHAGELFLLLIISLLIWRILKLVFFVEPIPERESLR